jgi:hypothetical protein
MSTKHWRGIFRMPDITTVSFFNWNMAKPREQKFQAAMKILFATNAGLLALIFDRDHPRLRDEPEVIMAHLCDLSSGEYLLVRLALDLWNDSGGVHIQELISRLDPMNFANAVAALWFLGPTIDELEIPLYE